MHWWICYFALLDIVAETAPSPLFQWPLGDKSGLLEVLSQGPSMQKPGNHCFHFGDNAVNIPYQAIRIESPTTPYLSVLLNEQNSFRDLAISMYIKSSGKPKGTLLQYNSDSAEKIRVVFDPLEGFAVISFRDEYDIPAGIVVADGIAVPDTWTHVIFQRAYKTGRITVYVNGERVVDEDDEFQDEVSLPATGQLFLGNTDPPNSEGDQQFEGFISCLQIFTHTLNTKDIKATQKFCLPEQWNLGYQVNFVRENEKSRIRCETVNPDSASKYKIITMSHLVNEKKWRDLKDHFRWEQSGKSDGYFRLTENKKAPLPGTLTIGNVKVVDLKTCVRLCIRVGGCMAFAFTTSGSDVNKCLLFDVIPVPLIMQSNVKFFVKKGVTY